MTSPIGIELDRRRLIKLGAFGLAALHMPGAMAAVLAQRGFTSGVASGEPAPRSMLLWTRFVADKDVRLTAEMSETEDFARVIAGGNVTASPQRDGCAKLTVGGLKPGQRYFYRFVAPDGTRSPVGRTRTLPDGAVPRFGLALFSCSNIAFGWFNAYAHAAARRDLELAVHVGDYLYEYGAGTYPSKNQAVPGRLLEPAHEIISLADYRLRFACYRADPDLQALHAAMPMIAMWDDHELANDAWMNGAQNHQPDKEGDWQLRKAAAMRAYREWMPVSDKPWREYQIGDLATIQLPETRITGRDKQLEYEELFKDGADAAAVLKSFRDGAWADPKRSLLGAAQEAWLANSFKQSAARKTRWQVLAQQIVMGPQVTPRGAETWVGPDAPDYVKKRVMLSQMAASLGLPGNLDSWDGYTAARGRLLETAMAADADLIVLSGDSHNAWGNNLIMGGKPAGVEFAGHSVTSSGIESYAPGASEADRVAALRRDNPGLAFCNTQDRGYVSVELRPDRTVGSWHFMETVKQRKPAVKQTVSKTVLRGRRAFA